VRPWAVAGQIWCLTSSVRDAAASGLMLARMAGIKQNGILGWLLRGSWLTSSEYLV